MVSKSAVRYFLALGPLTVALMLGGCVTYTPQQLSAMSAYQLCESLEYRANLTGETKTALASELDRRRENCVGQQSALRSAREQEIARRTYDTVSP